MSTGVSIPWAEGGAVELSAAQDLDRPVDYGGHCRRCGKRHAIASSPEAIAKARALLRALESAEGLPVPPGQAAGPPIAPRFLPGGGQMIGLLVAENERGERHDLRAFSGQWDGRASVPGWAPPLAFAEGEPAWKPEGEARLDALSETIEGARAATAGRRAELQAAIDGLVQKHARRRAALLDARRAARRARAEARQALLRDERLTAHPAALQRSLQMLDDASRREKARLRDLNLAHRAALQALESERTDLDAEVSRLSRQRKALSRSLMDRIHQAYRIPDRAGREHGLAEAFLHPEAIPSGAGDCCAPKLLAWAARHGLQPRALVELWFGAAPPAGGRQHGMRYGACAACCQPLLGFMLCPAPMGERNQEYAARGDAYRKRGTGHE